MKIEKQILGGEKPLSISYFFKRTKNDLFTQYKTRSDNYHVNYTFGGHYSLLAIIDDIYKNKSRNKKILIPSYLCNSIITTLKLRNIQYEFYHIDTSLNINNCDVLKKSSEKEISAIIVIDYFGINQFYENKLLLESLKTKGIKIIQDCVHSLILNKYKLYGDYAYNSFRKILPFEGSVLFSKEKMNINYAKGKNYNFIINKRIGQIYRYYYLKFNIARPSLYLKRFEVAEKYYYTNQIYPLLKLNKRLIKSVEIHKNKTNAKYFFDKLLNNYRKLTIERFEYSSIEPICFFVISKNRDKIRSELFNNNIFCPIHWNLPSEINDLEFNESIQISNNTFSIPLIDIDEGKFNHLISNLNRINNDGYLY